MSDGDAPGGELPSQFESALKKLEALFAGALGDAKLRSCGAAWTEIKHAKSAKKKTQILDEKARQWREDSVKAIRERFPQFVDLTAAFDEALHGDALHWATDRVWGTVEKQCGIRRPKPPEAKSADSVNRTMVFWFALASEGNTDVNLLPLQPWKAPDWLARGDEQRDSLIKEHVGHLCLRLNQAIKEEIDAAEIRRAISYGSVNGRILPERIHRAIRETDGSRRRHSPVDQRKELIARLKAWNPNPPARKICEWIDQRFEKAAASQRGNLAPLKSWQEQAPGERSWVSFYDHPKTRNRVRAYVNKVPPLKTSK